MAKTAVNTLIADIKILSDYNITDTDLDTLLLKPINLGLRRMAQWFMDEGLFDEIGASDSFSTVASQNYVDIATETVDFDQHVVLSERTNDKIIPIISYAEFVQKYPDSSNSKSATPDEAAFFGNRLYLGPTPSGVITLYLDYVKLITAVVAGDTLPFENKYDELLIAIGIEYLTKWLDRGNTAAIAIAQNDVLTLKHDLIVGASKNIGMNRQVQSRRESVPYFSPRKVV